MLTEGNQGNEEEIPASKNFVSYPSNLWKRGRRDGFGPGRRPDKKIERFFGKLSKMRWPVNLAFNRPDRY
jgi:hypothetical protein